MNDIQTVSVAFSSKLNLIPIKLIMRVPNPLNLESIEECPFYDEFIECNSASDSSSNLMKLRYLRDKIDDYVRSYGLYCDLAHTMPMMYIMM